MPDDAPPDTGSGGGTGLNRRVLGGIPLWGVYVIALAVGVVGLTWWRSRQVSASAAQTPAQDTGGSDATDSLDAGTLSTLQTEILALQGRASVPGPAGPAGPVGPKGPPGTVTPPPKPAPTPTPTKPPVRYYVVKPGDSLWKIAEKYYGNGALYGRLFTANKSGTRRADGTTGMIKNASLIQPGWMLIIP